MPQMKLRDLTPHWGTEITALDPLDALADPETSGQLQQLFDDRGILVFRDVDIDERTQANLIRMLIGMAPLAEGESANPRPNGETFYVSNKVKDGGAPFGRLLYHSDMMWSDHTFQVLSLYGVDVEDPATPTLFVSGVEAWETLPDDLREAVQDRSAVQGHAEEERNRDDPEVLITKFENLQTRTTPVPLTHPRTGRTILYVSEQMTREIEGLSHDESEALLEKLFAHLYQPVCVYEHDWREGDLVAWDNIAIQHGRPNVTLDGPARTLRKVFAPLPPRAANPSRPSFAKSG